MPDRTDPYRPAWTIRSPEGRQLRVEYDSFRDHWRVSPGEYVRRQLAAALSDATGSNRHAGWIERASRAIAAELDSTPRPGPR